MAFLPSLGQLIFGELKKNDKLVPISKTTGTPICVTTDDKTIEILIDQGKELNKAAFYNTYTVIGIIVIGIGWIFTSDNLKDLVQNTPSIKIMLHISLVVMQIFYLSGLWAFCWISYEIESYLPKNCRLIYIFNGASPKYIWHGGIFNSILLIIFAYLFHNIKKPNGS